MGPSSLVNACNSLSLSCLSLHRTLNPFVRSLCITYRPFNLDPWESGSISKRKIEAFELSIWSWSQPVQSDAISASTFGKSNECWRGQCRLLGERPCSFERQHFLLQMFEIVVALYSAAECHIFPSSLIPWSVWMSHPSAVICRGKMEVETSKEKKILRLAIRRE